MPDVFRFLRSPYARWRARRALRDGAVYRHPLETARGRLRTWSTVSVEGTTVILNDVSVYPEEPGTSARFEVGLREMVRLRDEVAANAALAGYDRLRIKAVRTDRLDATASHPLVDVVVDLSPYKARSRATGR